MIEPDSVPFIGECPVCGDYIDYCQGHGEIGDPVGFEIMEAHDNDDHSACFDPSRCIQ